jgi:NAD(P)-dependent dehydrogenase (short-subunit alcohol dehydrogenase family)
MQFQNKVALVTGGSRGIGRAIAIALAEAGATVVVNFLNSEKQARQVQQIIEQTGGKAIALQADVSEHQQLWLIPKQFKQELLKLTERNFTMKLTDKVSL